MQKYFEPVEEVTKFLHEKNKNARYILDIGPGIYPFLNATHYVDFINWNNGKEFINIDINEDKLPFTDNYFDFTYCRHVLEDIYNPKFALNEIMRVSKSFYIETPSPLAEFYRITYENDPCVFRGYIHHRYFIWYDNVKNEISFLPKFPLIEYTIANGIDKQIDNLLKNNKLYWNTYMFIDKSIHNIPKITNYQHSSNFNIITNYDKKIIEGMNTSIDSTNYFNNTYLHI